MMTSLDVDKFTELNDHTAILYLSKLSKIDYERIREKEAIRLKIRVSILDELVESVREKAVISSGINEPMEPWDEPVDGFVLLNQLELLLNKYVVFTSTHEAKAISLWIVHTYCVNLTDTSPILYISSPEKRCGKSTLLTILLRLVNNPLAASNITPSATFRCIEEWSPTLLLDEADTFMRYNEELRGIINSGHTRDLAFVVRCNGENNVPQRYSTWCPKVIAGIGRLAGTIEDRAIIISMRRKLLKETRDKLNTASVAEFNILARKCIRFVLDNFHKLQTGKFSEPNLSNDRALDNWRPLLLIAEVVGHEWPTYASNAAVYLSCDKEGDESNLNIELLVDIKKIFEHDNVDRLSTENLITKLCSDKERPWVTFNDGMQITPHQIAKMLCQFGIRSRTIRLESDKTLKGYCLDFFEDAFARYIPVIIVTSSQSL